MRKLFLFLLFGMFSLGIHAQEPLRLSDPNISFEFVSSAVSGSVAGFSSTSTIDLSRLEQAPIKGSVAVETLKTGNFLRDWSLRSGKYFDADDYPTISFIGTEVRKTAPGFTVSGELTIKDVTRSVSIAFIQNGTALAGTVTLFTSDYGIAIKKKKEDNKVVVTLRFNLR